MWWRQLTCRFKSVVFNPEANTTKKTKKNLKVVYHLFSINGSSNLFSLNVLSDFKVTIGVTIIGVPVTQMMEGQSSLTQLCFESPYRTPREISMTSLIGRFSRGPEMSTITPTMRMSRCGHLVAGVVKPT